MAMRLADIMSQKLFSVHPTMLLSDLEWEFSRRRISGAPVIEDGKLVGVISRADIVRRIGFSHAMSEMAVDYYQQLERAVNGDAPEQLERLADQDLGSQLRSLHVRDVMTTHPATLGPDATPQQAAQLMLAKGVHRVIVTVSEQPVGMVSTFDLIRLLANSPSR